MRIAMRAAVCLLLLPVAAIGCKRGGEQEQTQQSSGEVKTFPIRGKVVSVNAAKGSVLLDHEAIPGFMDAMTMSYKLKDPNVLSELHAGDRITAKLLVHKNGDQYSDAVLDQIVVTAQARPDYKPTSQYHAPEQGDAVPDFKLVNENGRSIHLGQFKGKAVLLTFIYTRCPLPDFCPKMNHNFAEVDKALAADPPVYAETHLLSISFDPKNDTPAVLKQYGKAYAGADTKFTHWEFAVPPANELPEMAKWFDVGYSPAEDGSITHSLSTVLIDKDGKVAAWYPTNDWSPADVVTKIKSVA